MSRISSPLEIYKILPKSNCRECGIPTCLAFSAAVINEQKHLSDCPHLDRDTLAQFEGQIDRHISMEDIQEETLQQLKREISSMNFASVAERLGATLDGESLVVKCLGKEFAIDREGNIASQCHTHAWFSIPLLHYVLFGHGTNISGRWVPFRELENGRTWEPLFRQRCEKPMKELADTHTELFDDLISLFDATRSVNHFSSDVSVVLYPFPKVPILISYWKPEDDLESKLHIFYDSTAEENLKIESIYTLGFGLATMFEKIIDRHS